MHFPNSACLFFGTCAKEMTPCRNPLVLPSVVTQGRLKGINQGVLPYPMPKNRLEGRLRRFSFFCPVAFLGFRHFPFRFKNIVFHDDSPPSVLRLSMSLSKRLISPPFCPSVSFLSCLPFCLEIVVASKLKRGVAPGGVVTSLCLSLYPFGFSVN